MISLRRGGVPIAAAVLAALAWAALARADQPLAPTLYPIATAKSGPAGIAAGSDGKMWFTESTGHKIASISALGTITEFSAGLSTGADPATITPGVAGTLWFTEPMGGRVGEVTIPAGTIDELRLSGDRPMPGGVAVDAQGEVWVTLASHQIEAVAPPYGSANTTLYPRTGSLDSGLATPGSIVLGPDGNLWFTERISGTVVTDKVAMITPTGTITEYPLPRTGTLGQIVVGPDGNLWTGVVGTSPNPSTVLRITPAGVITPFDLPASSTANVGVIASGPDGELWMAGGGGLTSVTTAGVFTGYPALLPTGDTISAMHSDVGGADALWLTDQTAGSLYRVPLAPPPPPPAPPPPPPPPPPPTLSVALMPVSAVAKTGVVLSGTISEAPASPPTATSYLFQYGTSTAYGSSTPPANATATSAGLPVSAPVTGLAPYTTYHYRVVASDCAAASCQAVSPDQSFTTGSTLQPALHVTLGATATAGQVLIKLRGHHHFKRLKVGELIPLGSTIDARHGTVLIQSAIAGSPGQLASGLFSRGIFTVTQPAGGTVTVLVLLSAFKSCSVHKPTSAHAAASAARLKKKKAVSHKVVNEVFGNAHGQFSTRGHYATAADQGTGWSTADRCDGTQISVSLGMVSVTDFKRHRTVLLTAGHHYLAHAP